MQSSVNTLYKSTHKKAFFSHFLSTLLVIGCLAFLTFHYWFPAGLRQLTGGLKLFLLFAMGLLASGPLLTAILYRSTKTRRALLVDTVLIALLQGMVLLLGLHALVQVRPLALIFETDRFRVISYADIPVQALPSLKGWTRPWSLDGPLVAGLRAAQSEDERAQRFDDMLVDISPSQRPTYWQDLTHSSEEIRRNARQLSDLRSAYPAQWEIIDQVAQQVTDDLTPDGKKGIWLPLVSRASLDWVILLDTQTLQPKAFLPLDGFIQ